MRVSNIKIKTSDDWWSYVEKYKDELIIIMSQFGGLEVFNKGLNKKNWALVSSGLNDAWFKAPDDYNYLHSLDCWNLLCDLCSEVWVFEDLEIVRES